MAGASSAAASLMSDVFMESPLGCGFLLQRCIPVYRDATARGIQVKSDTKMDTNAFRFSRISSAPMLTP
jgi:hypothetical protein